MLQLFLIIFMLIEVGILNIWTSFCYLYMLTHFTPVHFFWAQESVLLCVPLCNRPKEIQCMQCFRFYVKTPFAKGWRPYPMLPGITGKDRLGVGGFSKWRISLWQIWNNRYRTYFFHQLTQISHFLLSNGLINR